MTQLIKTLLNLGVLAECLLHLLTIRMQCLLGGVYCKLQKVSSCCLGGTIERCYQMQKKLPRGRAAQPMPF